MSLYSEQTMQAIMKKNIGEMNSHLADMKHNQIFAMFNAMTSVKLQYGKISNAYMSEIGAAQLGHSTLFTFESFVLNLVITYTYTYHYNYQFFHTPPLFHQKSLDHTIR